MADGFSLHLVPLSSGRDYAGDVTITSDEAFVIVSGIPTDAGVTGSYAGFLLDSDPAGDYIVPGGMGGLPYLDFLARAGTYRVRFAGPVLAVVIATRSALSPTAYAESTP